MQILVINSGSSSIKFQLLKMPEAHLRAVGLVERIGLSDSVVKVSIGDNKQRIVQDIPDHKAGLEAVSRILMDSENGIIKSPDEITAVGHRVVHGGRAFAATTEITQAVEEQIHELSKLAPLHNPANLAGIQVAKEVFANARQVAVFDTAFHQSIPGKAHKYAIPKELDTEHGIRVYGFHGTSHKFVSEKARAFLGTEKSEKIITIHLGNGCSMTAIQDGQSVDHSLGFSPAGGLIMGTRSGDLDPLVTYHLVNELGYTLEEATQMIQKKSGLLGLTGFSDMREIQEQAQSGNEDCQEALEMTAYRIKKYVGSYAAAMNGLDAIVFTGGIGENSDVMRDLVCQNMDYLGIQLDQEANEHRSNEIRDVSSKRSNVRVLVVPTNEELEIAKQTFELIS